MSYLEFYQSQPIDGLRKLKCLQWELRMSAKDEVISWTDERVEQLKKLWAEGLSASQIAAQLGGVTRNAVIGKVHRLGLSGRIKPQNTSIARTKRVSETYMRPSVNRNSGSASSGGGARHMSSGSAALKTDASMYLAPHIDIQPAQVIMFAPEGTRLTLLELTEKSCRFPIGDPTQSDFRFCGCDSNGSLPYCSFHSTIAYQSTGDRRRKPAVQ